MIFRKYILTLIIASGLLSFTRPEYISFSKSGSPIEICNNAIDDDGDGLIDLNDEDCFCNEIEPIASLIPNASFEDTDCCPQMQSQLNCATGWEQASAPTTDFIHLCGWLGWNDQDGTGEVYPPPMPFPDGSGIVGFRDGLITPPGGVSENGRNEPNWKEYAGACLTGQMKKDSLYRIEFDLGFVSGRISPPINLTIFGTSDCAKLPFGPSTIEDLVGCPTNTEGWIELGNVYVFGGDNKWVQSSIEFIPNINISAIAIGPDCNNNVFDLNNLYYYLDNLILNEAQSFEFEIQEEGHPCSPDFSLAVNEYLSLDYQWYLNGVALIGETSNELTQNYGEGLYQVMIDNGSECSLINYGELIIPVESGSGQVTICEEDNYLFGGNVLTEEGVYYDTLTSFHGCDSLVELNLIVESNVIDSIEAFTFSGVVFEYEGEEFHEPGEYWVSTLTDEGCEKQTLVQLSFYDIYIPNIFSPNAPGINNTFTIFTQAEFEAEFIVYIYDRWGNLMFNGKEWNGYSDNRLASEGVYVYLVELDSGNGQPHYLHGTVSLVY